MSSLSGMYNKSMTVNRQPFKSDGQGGWIPNGAVVQKAIGVKGLIDIKNVRQERHVGGREIVGTHVLYTDYVLEDTYFLPNDLITDVFLLSDNTQFDLDTVNTPEGVKTIHRTYQVIRGWDPNGERDHLEVDLIVYKGRNPIQ